MSELLKPYEFQFLDFKGLSGDPDDWLVLGQTTLLVGRNNVGKSAVIDAIRFSLDQSVAFNSDWHRHGKEARFRIRQSLRQNELQQIFPENRLGGSIGGSHWEYGRQFVGQSLVREFDQSRAKSLIEGPDFSGLGRERVEYERTLIDNAPAPNVSVSGIAAERNVVPESSKIPEPVQADGVGLTNLIRAFLYNSNLDMAEVEYSLLKDLNKIFESDFCFERILARQDGDGPWEIFLVPSGGAPVRLSQSGSSLKSIFIILATLKLNRLVDRGSRVSNRVFFVEEPENNLHPSLLRRLLDFMHVYAGENNTALVLTTHSAAAIDWASRKSGVQLYHVAREDSGVQIRCVREYGATRKLLDDLDIRASEILQANGVIWVEGPTDRIYLKRWIDLVTRGKLVEGQHYSIMFYGGKLLSHLSCSNPDQPSDLLHLLRMNRNLALVMDSDRRILKSGRFRASIGRTKLRIKSEALDTGAHIWLTKGREIENYLSNDVILKLSPKTKKVGEFDSVIESIGMSSKVELAEKAEVMIEEGDLDVLDLRERVNDLVKVILSWNRAAL